MSKKESPSKKMLRDSKRDKEKIVGPLQMTPKLNGRLVNFDTNHHLNPTMQTLDMIKRTGKMALGRRPAS